MGKIGGILDSVNWGGELGICPIHYLIYFN